MSRQAAHAKLKTLLPAQFEDVVFQFGMPSAYLRREVALAQQILDLIRYAEQQHNGLEKLLDILNTPPPRAPDAGQDLQPFEPETVSAEMLQSRLQTATGKAPPPEVTAEFPPEGMRETVIKQAVVRVWQGEPQPGNTAAKYLGTAFFIAPGLLLTAAHVVKGRTDLWLQGNAWLGRIRDRALKVIPHPDANIDIALLVPGKADGPPGIALSPSSVVLAQGEELILWGYGTDDGEIERIPATVRGYLDTWQQECVHTNNAPGMSGGPALREKQGGWHLVGVMPGRYPDANKTALVPLEVFREFVTQHLQRPASPPLPVTPSAESLKLVREQVAKQLQTCPVLHKALQAETGNVGTPAEDAERLADPDDLENAVVNLHNAMTAALDNSAEPRRISDTAVTILGWLLLLAVRPGWLEAQQHSLAAGAALDFGLPLRTEAGVEISLAHLEQRPAQLAVSPDRRRTFGRDSIHGDDLLEMGWLKEDVAAGVKRELWLRLFHEDKTRFSPDDDKKLNAKIRQSRKMRKGYYYLLTPAANPANPLHDRNVCRMLLEQLRDFKAVYYGVEGGDSVLIEIEDELESLVNLFLETVQNHP
jgi:hypothetical protein